MAYNVVYTGTDEGEFIVAPPGSDNVYIYGLGGDDDLGQYGDGANAVVSGGDGDDFVYRSFGDGANVTLLGDNGNDYLGTYELVADNVTASGGSGHDEIAIFHTVGLNALSVSGGDGDDYVLVIDAESKDLHVSGGAGNDTIHVDDIEDPGTRVHLDGGEGDDTVGAYVYRVDGVTMTGGAGDDFLGLQGFIYDQVELQGGAGDDIMVVNLYGHNVTVAGGDGNDTIIAQVAGAHVAVSGGNGNDDVTAGLYAFYSETNGDVSGGDGNDKIEMDVTVYDGVNNADASGGDGDDDVHTDIETYGTDRLQGGSGSDTLWGGAGNDTVSGARGDDYLHGEDDVDYDKLYGDTGSDVLVGGVSDLLNGGEDDDIMIGVDGSTRFVGGPGLNIIIDGRGLNYTISNSNGGVDKYAVCADNRRGQDWGCLTGFACKLSDGRSPGNRKAGDQCLPACLVDNIPVVGNTSIASSCYGNGPFVQAIYLLSFATCNYTYTLNIDLVREGVAAWLGVPPCQVGVNSTLGGTSSRRRHLLQLGELAEDQIEIAIEAFASLDHSAQSIQDIFRSADFTAFLASLFESFGPVAETLLRALVVDDLSSVKSDPHFVSARGDRFDFVGRAERSYCVLSDERVHVNARLMGVANASDATGGASIKAASARRVSKKGGDARTWMDQISVMYGNDRVLVDANSRPGAPYAASFGTVLLNGVSRGRGQGELTGGGKPF
eukprot:jgi/Mesvir1/15846/Mv03394-RA.1